MTTQAEARAANAVLLYTDLRRDIEGLISVHGAGSERVSEFINATPLAERSPFEIDTFLYALVEDAYRLNQEVIYALDSVHTAAGDKREYGYGRPKWGLDDTDALAKATNLALGQDPAAAGYVVTQATQALTKYDAAVAALRANQETQEPLHEEFQARRWTRAFLVTDGHAHSSRSCSTCFPTTHFTWLPFLSGRDEADIVAMAGERACTVCYPTAPTLRDFEKASPLFTEEEAERAKARDQRAAEKQERLAKKIAAGLTEDGSEFLCSWREENGRRWDGATRTYVDGPVEHTERFKTEKAAVQWVVQERAWGQEGPRTAEKRPAFDAIYQAVATKHGKTIAEVLAEVDAKVVAKRKRDSR